MILCQVCGNSIDAASLYCPYCGSKQEMDEVFPARIQFSQKTVNLEQGLPTVEEAIVRLKRELDTARYEKQRIITFIHGYGSSGKGGAIRLECRKYLAYLLSTGSIQSVIHGEEFSRRHGAAKHLLGRFPALSRHPYLNQHNKGITLVQVC